MSAPPKQELKSQNIRIYKEDYIAIKEEIQPLLNITLTEIARNALHQAVEQLLGKINEQRSKSTDNNEPIEF